MRADRSWGANEPRSRREARDPGRDLVGLREVAARKISRGVGDRHETRQMGHRRQDLGEAEAPCWHMEQRAT